MVYTIKVYPQGWGREVYRVIQISGDATFDDLAMTILIAFDFDSDHLYEFCMDMKPYRPYNYKKDADWDGGPGTDVTLEDAGICQKQKFLFHYDYGDDWMFICTVQKATMGGTSDPDGWNFGSVIKRKGEIEQYPSWDDEDEEDEEFEDDED